MIITMATEQNNIQINTFNEGMNSDWSYDNLKISYDIEGAYNEK